MARTKEQINSAKEIINMGLAKVCESYELIQTEMANLPHQRGVAHQSLDRRTGQHVVGSKEGFSASYVDSQGQGYSIQIWRIQ